MAITIEVTRGRYLRHLRDLHGWPLRDCVQRLNAVLPSNEHVSHAWMHLLENDSEKCIVTPVRALAFAKVLGADIVELGVDDNDWKAFALLTENVGDLPATRPKRGRDRPKRSNTCISDRVIARPNAPLKCQPLGGTLLWGRGNAYSS